MDETTREEFLQRIKREVSALSAQDRDVMKHAMTVVVRMSADPRLRPLTLLMPSEEAVARIDVEEELTPELCDQVLGLFLDQVILGELPSPGAIEGASEQRQFSTLGGATAVLHCDGGKLFLTDSNGRRVGVSDPIVQQPSFSIRTSDDFLMLDVWSFS